MSPDAPAAVRNALISGVNSVYGLRYSIELSPVCEANGEIRAASAAPADLAASVFWEGGWRDPSTEAIFDARLHPLRPFRREESGSKRDGRELPRLRMPVVGEVSNLIKGVASAASMGPEVSIGSHCAAYC